ncbi:MAG TPA: ABC transporter permease subunit [Feifaniaceae bacterium]|nr:ABC transporter permease subunit [Feifaniaceae bacterium]
MQKRLPRFLIQAFLLVLAVCVLVPFVYIVLISFGKHVSGTSTVVPKELTLENYVKLFTQTSFLRWMGNSLFVALGTTVIAVLLVSVSVYVFSRMRFRGRMQLFNAVLLIQIFPLTLSMVSLFHIFVQFDLVNNLLGLILVDSAISSAGLVLLAKGYFDTIPYELDEAAMIDGANRWQIITRITLPLAKPMLAVIAIQSFVISYNEYVIASTIMSEGLDRFPLAVALQSMITGQYGQNWSLYCAAAVLGSIPMLVLFYSLQNYFIGGLTEGGTKG